MRIIHKKLSEGEHYIVEDITVKKTDDIIYIARDSVTFVMMKKTTVGGQKVYAITDGYRIYVIN